MLEIADILNFFQAKQEDIGIEIDEDKIRLTFEEFKRVFNSRPIRDNIGGIGPRPSAWLFITAKLLNPRLIIESGVWRGHSTWVLRQACPDADIHAFDINLNHLVHRETTIHYHEGDWTSHRFKHIYPERSLIFFDDHVNQARRVKESFDRGFKYLIFDDNTPVDKAERAGIPPFPTLHMLFDPTAAFGDRFQWRIKNGKPHTYIYKKKDTFGAKNLINHYFVFPETYCFLSFVKLKSKKWRKKSRNSEP